MHFCFATDPYSQKAYTLFVFIEKNLLTLTKAHINMFKNTHLLQWDFNLA